MNNVELNIDQSRSLLLEQLQKVDGYTNQKPMVKNIGPYDRFTPVIKTTQLNLEGVPPEKLWFWSDQHFGHKNIIGYANRPFENTMDMQTTMMYNYETTVKSDDVCIWVGDVAFQSHNIVNAEILNDLPGYKILVIGNHDFGYRTKELIPYDFDEIHLVLHLRNFIISHHPWWDVPHGWKQIHGHIHNHKTNNPNHINVSVEHLDYKPIRFSAILDAHK